MTLAPSLLRAGVAVRDVTPRQPLFLVGYPHVPRVSTGCHDPLLASALYLANETAALLLVSVDVLFISPETARTCREAIARATGIPSAHILLSATHTHSGPVTNQMLAWRADPVVPPPDPAYLDQFHAGIIDAAIAAVRSAGAAELAITSANLQGVGCNRRSPDGPFDPQAGLLAIRREGRLAALALIYGMHPTVLHEDSTLISADFPHFTRSHLAEAFPGLTTIYHTAPSGNLSPRYHVRAQTFAEAERLGRSLGTAAAAALHALRDADFQSAVPLAGFQAWAELVPNRFATVPEAEAALAAARLQYESLKAQGAPHGPVRTAECTLFGCEEGLTLAQAQAAGQTALWQERFGRAEVQVFRMGDAVVVGLPGEQFVEYALQLKRGAARRTFVISLANGELQGYIVTPEAARQGGYESAFALFAPASGARLVEAVQRLMPLAEGRL